ncbi:MAG: LysM peptidoglycan-binding domain-containing protein [Verrucomicrobiaceae bacterium]|nr:LysM peptidoglycan-binding domain-containing protein [Verrucomicrobiaceae bacterium]
MLRNKRLVIVLCVDINLWKIFTLKEIIMKKYILFTVLATLSINAWAQNSTILIDLRQDVNLMRREVGELRLEVEQLRSENEQLKKLVDKLRSSSIGSESVRSQVSSVKASVSAQNEALKREIIARVKKDIDALAEQTNSAIQKLAKAVSATPQIATPKTFSDNYPKTGITYKVKSGDSVSKIARANGSRIQWILDANQIGDPKDLRVGAEIFIPQK